MYFINKRLTNKLNLQKVFLSISGISVSDITKTIQLISKNCSSISFQNLSTNNKNSGNTNINLFIIPKDFTKIDLIVNEISIALLIAI